MPYSRTVIVHLGISWLMSVVLQGLLIGGRYAGWYPDYWEYAADYEACVLGGVLVSVNGEDCTGEMGS